MDVRRIKELACRVGEIYGREGESEEAIIIMYEIDNLLDDGVLLENVIGADNVY